jgi:virulence-associated protein VapD
MYYIDEKTMKQIKEVKEQINKILETIPTDDIKEAVNKYQDAVKNIRFYTKEEWDKIFETQKSLI